MCLSPYPNLNNEICVLVPTCSVTTVPHLSSAGNQFSDQRLSFLGGRWVRQTHRTITAPRRLPKEKKEAKGILSQLGAAGDPTECNSIPEMRAVWPKTSKKKNGTGNTTVHQYLHFIFISIYFFILLPFTFHPPPAPTAAEDSYTYPYPPA